jgi:hypothetical protein
MKDAMVAVWQCGKHQWKAPPICIALSVRQPATLLTLRLSYLLMSNAGLVRRSSIAAVRSYGTQCWCLLFIRHGQGMYITLYYQSLQIINGLRQWRE